MPLIRLFLGWFGLQAVTRGQRKAGGTIQNASFLRRKLAPERLRVNALLALFRRQVAHVADRSVKGLAAIRGKFPELLKQLPRIVLLPGRQVLPGFHPVENMLLLLRRQA
jgi:hypothetical protein